MKIYIDNTPFPSGIVDNYEPITVFIMKENIYRTTSELFETAYILITLLGVICVVILGVGLQLHRLLKKFGKEKEGFSTSFAKPVSEQHYFPLKSENNRLESVLLDPKVINATMYSPNSFEGGVLDKNVVDSYPDNSIKEEKEVKKFDE